MWRAVKQVDEQQHWLAVSPDGRVHCGDNQGVLEIKCPYSQRIYPEIPPYYMDQVGKILCHIPRDIQLCNVL